MIPIKDNYRTIQGLSEKLLELMWRVYYGQKNNKQII